MCDGGRATQIAFCAREDKTICMKEEEERGEMKEAHRKRDEGDGEGEG